MKCLVRDGRTGPRRREEEGRRAHCFRGEYIRTHAYLIVGRSSSSSSASSSRRRRIETKRKLKKKREIKFISFHFHDVPLGESKNRNRRRSCATGRRASERNSIVVFGVIDDAFVRRLRRLGTETVERKGGKSSSTESHRVNRHLLVGWTIDCIELDFVSS